MFIYLKGNGYLVPHFVDLIRVIRHIPGSLNKNFRLNVLYRTHKVQHHVCHKIISDCISAIHTHTAFLVKQKLWLLNITPPVSSYKSCRCFVRSIKSQNLWLWKHTDYNTIDLIMGFYWLGLLSVKNGWAGDISVCVMKPINRIDKVPNDRLMCTTYTCQDTNGYVTETKYEYCTETAFNHKHIVSGHHCQLMTPYCDTSQYPNQCRIIFIVGILWYQL